MATKTTMTRLNPALTALLAAVALSGCTEQRPAEFNYKEEDKIFSISSLRSAGIAVTTGNEQSALAESPDSMRASAEAGSYRVANVRGANKLEGLFEDLFISGRAESRYDVRLDVNRKFVTAFKVITNPADATAIENELAVRVNLENGRVQSLVPLFQVEIESYGKVARTLNDLREETSALELTESDWEDATHVKITPLASKRQMVEAALASDNLSESRQIYLRSRIDGALITRSALARDLEIRVAAPLAASAEGPLAEDPLFLTELDQDRMNLFEVTTSDSRTLTDEDRAVIRRGGDEALKSCSDELKARLPESQRENCVVVLRYRVPVTGVLAERALVDSDGTRAPTIRYIGVTNNPDSARLVRVTPNVTPETVVRGDDLFVLDSRDTLVVDQLRGHEYLMRRTLQDSPNSFAYTFAGASGALEIVRFVPEEGSIRVVRAAPLVSRPGTTPVDNETLMIIPASYFRPVMTSATGQALTRPRYVHADHTASGAIARVSWSDNRMPNVSSPLDYYGIEECFTGAREELISDVDQRLQNAGMLSLSVTRTYPASPAAGCADFCLGYFDAVQTSFTFKERISFKRYKGLNETIDEVPLLDIPYDAQKKLGFGLFTYSKKRPDQYGQTHLDGTEIPLPAIFNLRNGRKITYVLAGIPADGSLREAVIQATSEVIADWNRAMHQALDGTSMARSGDYLELKVEGVDIEPGQIGDLDRNYLYWVQKQTDVPLLGLGGAHPNPRSGAVEAASVFIYGGNMLQSVNSLRRTERAKREYLAQATPTLPAAPGGGETGTESGGTPATSVPSPASMIPSLASGAAVPAQAASLVERIRNSSLKLGRAASHLQNATLSPTISGPGLVNQPVETLSRESLSRLIGDTLKTRGELAKSLGRASESQRREQILNELRRSQRSVALYQALHRAMTDGNAANSRQLSLRINEELVTLLEGQIPPRAMAELRSRTSRERVASRVMERMRDAQICVHEGAQVPSVKGNIDDLTDQQILMSLYKPTLAHEIGHNLGLRHNFIASFDQANWKFDESDTSTRDYTSVMEYSQTDHETYDGMGPYDVNAIRAAYAGLVELHPQVLEAAAAAGIPTVAGKYLTLDTLKQGLGLSSWLGLTSSDVKDVIPLKQYMYCSDEDADGSPLCRRFDRGATPSEIVDAAVLDYRAYYTLRNLPNNRLRFGWWDMGNYIGGLFGSFIQVRQFLEETFYQLTENGGSDAEVEALVQAYVPAIAKGLRFFHSVVRNPDAPGYAATSNDRFVEESVGNGGKIPVERKALNSILQDMEDERLVVRGIEYDKVIALLMLTERSFGFPRYERVSIRLSYPDVERMLIEAEKPTDLPTLSLLSEILSNNVTPQADTPVGLLDLPLTYKADLTEMIRIYGLIGAIMSLDINGLEAADNLSAHFRVMSGFRPPNGITAVAQTGANASAATTLKYWAPEDAAVGSALMTSVGTLDQVMSVRGKIRADFKTWILARVAQITAEAEAEAAAEASGQSGEEAVTPGTPEAAVQDRVRAHVIAEFEAILREAQLARLKRKIEAELATLPESAGPRTLAEAEGVIFQIITLTYRIQAMAEMAQQLGIPQLQAQVRDMVTETKIQIANLTKESPGLGMLISLVPARELEVPALSSLVSASQIDNERGLQFRNAEILNQIFYSVHPEYNRN
ncbi:MAG: zinc-dependent metalloprotease [Bdellovibrionales bacterium]|nr:zinc-dependent metalloprotease [Bdellovibrionales bacterium]